MTEKTKTKLGTDQRGEVHTKNFKKDLKLQSGQIAIVDASILDACNSPLADDAIVVPTKWAEGMFTISVKFDDAILKKLSIKPKKDQLGNVVEKMIGNPPDDEETRAKKITDAKIAEGEAGVLPINDRGNGRIDRRLREAMGSKSAKRTMKAHHGKRTGQKPNPEARALNAGRRQRGTLAKHNNKLKENVSPSLKSIYEFIISSMKSQVTVESIEQVDNKLLLNSIVEKMYTMCLTGWKPQNNTIIHEETGIKISSSQWQVKDGLLYDKNGKRPNIDFDWAYNTREALKEYTAAKNVNMVEDILKHGRGITG